MTKPVDVTPAAQAEVDAAIDWHLQEDSRTAAEFVTEYEQALRTVVKYVSSYAEYLHGTKRQLFAKYQYQLIVRELLDRIEIVAVADLRRKPGYWKSRLK